MAPFFLLLICCAFVVPAMLGILGQAWIDARPARRRKRSGSFHAEDGSMSRPTRTPASIAHFYREHPMTSDAALLSAAIKMVAINEAPRPEAGTVQALKVIEGREQDKIPQPQPSVQSRPARPAKQR
jgi:hypothetical protein